MVENPTPAVEIEYAASQRGGPYADDAFDTMATRFRDVQDRYGRHAVGDRAIEQTLYTWIASGDLSVELAFRLDQLSARP